MEVDIRHYDLEDVTLAPEGEFLVLKVTNDNIEDRMVCKMLNCLLLAIENFVML